MVPKERRRDLIAVLGGPPVEKSLKMIQKYVFMKKQIFPVTLKFITRLLTKYEVQQISFDAMKKSHKLLKYYKKIPDFR